MDSTSKVSLLAIFLILFVTCSYFIFSNKGKFNSAFEADQACHYEARILTTESQKLSCDHDTETRQWLLYSIDSTNSIANVTNRYRY